MDGVAQGRNSSATCGWVVGDGEKLPFADQSVDYVTHIGSLEHYLSPLEGAQQIARILKPNGKACILLPNAFGLWGNIKHVWQHGEIYDDGQPLQRYATRQTWEKMLMMSGLKIDKVVKYDEVDLPRTKQDFLWLAKRPQKLLRKIIATVAPLNLRQSFCFYMSPVTRVFAIINTVFGSFLRPSKRSRLIFVAATVILSIGLLGLIVYRQKDILSTYKWDIKWWAFFVSFASYMLALLGVVQLWIWILEQFSIHIPFSKHFHYITVSNLARRLPGTVWYIAWRAKMYQENDLGPGIISISSGIELALLIVSGVIVSILFAFKHCFSTRQECGGFWRCFF